MQDWCITEAGLIRALTSHVANLFQRTSKVRRVVLDRSSAVLARRQGHQRMQVLKNIIMLRLKVGCEKLFYAAFESIVARKKES